MPIQELNTTPALEDRLGAVVDSIKQTLIALPRFKPADAVLAVEFDVMLGNLLQTALDISAAVAVDKASIMVAIELAQQRKDHAVAMQKLQDQQDADSRAAALPFLSKGAAS